MDFFSIDYYPFYILVGIPLFFVVQWALYRKGKGTRKTVLTVILTIVLTPLVFYLLVSAFLMTMFYEPSQRFSSLGWKTNKEYRYRMLDDLLEKKTLIHKDTLALKEMLGDDFIRQSDQSWYYSAGTASHGFGIRGHSLSINISGDKVLKADHHYWDD